MDLLSLYVNSINTLYFSCLDEVRAQCDKKIQESSRAWHILVSSKSGAGNTVKVILVVRIVSCLEQDVV